MKNKTPFVLVDQDINTTDQLNAISNEIEN